MLKSQLNNNFHMRKVISVEYFQVTLIRRLLTLFNTYSNFGSILYLVM